MDERSLITAKMIGNEFRYCMLSNGWWTDEPRVEERKYRTFRRFHIHCGDAGITLDVAPSDLELSLDDFTARHLVPYIEELKRLKSK